jgi:hypothetical protein
MRRIPGYLFHHAKTRVSGSMLIQQPGASNEMKTYVAFVKMDAMREKTILFTLPSLGRWAFCAPDEKHLFTFHFLICGPKS